MGSLCGGSESGQSYNQTERTRDKKSHDRSDSKDGSKDGSNGVNDSRFYVSFNEKCNADTEFDFTVTYVDSDEKNGNKIGESSNYRSVDLYRTSENGARISDVTRIINSKGEFYFLLHNHTGNGDDYSRIEKFEMIVDKSNNVSFKYISTPCEKVFANMNVNMEGLELVKDDEGNEIGLLMCNDLWFDPQTNSHLFFLSFSGKPDKPSKPAQFSPNIIFSMNDEGIGEWSGITYYKSLKYNKDGYIIVPQSLGLAKGGSDESGKMQIDWDPFWQWTKTNSNDDYRPYMLFFDRQSLIKKWLAGDNEDQVLTPEYIYVNIQENGFKNENGLFNKYDKEKGFQNEGFESLAIDENDNCVFSCEFTDKNKISESMPHGYTFAFLLCGKISLNNDKNLLEIELNTNEYKTIGNSFKDSRGDNSSQEALLYYNPKLF